MTEKKPSAESTVKNIRRNSKKKYTAEEKISIVLEGLRGKMSFAELCRKEVINQNSYYKWSKEFLKAGKRFVSYYNFERYHESLDNLTPADGYFGRKKVVLSERE